MSDGVMVKLEAFTAKKILSCALTIIRPVGVANPGINISCWPSLGTLSANFMGKEAPPLAEKKMSTF